MADALETRNFFPELTRTETPTASGSSIVSYTHELSKDAPIVMLIHGYPQSAFEWRYVSSPLRVSRS